MSLPTWARHLLFWGALLLGLGAFGYVLYTLDLPKTMDAVRSVGAGGVAIYTALTAASLVFPALGWWILMRAEGIPATPAMAIKANFMGYPVNLMTPSAYLGGEPVKLFYVAGRLGVPKTAVLGTIIVNKVQELGAIILVLVAASIYVLGATDLLSARHEIVLGALSAAAFAFVALIVWAILAGKKPTLRVLGAVAALGLFRRRIDALKPKADEMETQIRDAFVRRWKTFLLSAAVTSVTAVAFFFKPAMFDLFARPAGPRLPFETVCVIYLLTNVINVFQIVPGSLGLFEAIVAATFGTMKGDWTADTLGAYLVVNRFADVAVFSIGFVLLVHYGLTAFARGKEPPTAA